MRPGETESSAVEIRLYSVAFLEALLAVGCKVYGHASLNGTVCKLYSKLKHRCAYDLIHANWVDFGFGSLEAAVTLSSNQRSVVISRMIATSPVTFQHQLVSDGRQPNQQQSSGLASKCPTRALIETDN